MKVKLVWDNANLCWFAPLDRPEVWQAMEQHGITIDPDDSDLEVVDVTVPYQPKRDFVVFNRIDTSFVTNKALECGAIGCIVPTLSEDQQASREYARLPYRGEPPFPVRPLNTTLWRYLHNEESWRPSPKLIAENLPGKSLDVFFCGTTHYPNCPYASEHRLGLLKQWQQVPPSGLGIFSGLRQRAIGPDDHWRLMQRARVAISPWGVTEACWRDYEACLAECVMVKPLGPKIDCGTDNLPWTESNTVWCNPDYSDLGQAITAALDLWNRNTLEQIRYQAYSLGSDLNELAARFCRIIKGFAEC